MALPACFHLADTVFPAVRAEAARRLAADGWTQQRIAARLQVSQAMVSKYIHSAPAEDALVLRLADELLQDSGDSWCALLADTGAGHDAALTDLLQAERRLLEASPLAVMPQVGINIARTLPDATGPDDVLAYPARIVADGRRFLRPAAPRLGASSHLSACLMAWRQHDASLHAIANIRGGPAIADATMDGDGDRGALFTAAVRGQDPVPRVVHDLGGIGIEPCIYIAGPTATAVVDRILTIAQVTP